MITLRAKHTIYGLKENPMEPTHAPEIFTTDEKTAAELLGNNAAEEIAADDLLEKAEESETEADRLRIEAAQLKAAAEQKDLADEQEGEAKTEQEGEAKTEQEGEVTV